MKRVAFRVVGRVQGVGFRRAAAREAQRLGLRGHVQNLADGAVAGEACGTAEQLAAFQRWLGRGPALAHVAAVAWSELGEAGDGPAGFEVRRDGL